MANKNKKNLEREEIKVGNEAIMDGKEKNFQKNGQEKSNSENPVEQVLKYLFDSKKSNYSDFKEGIKKKINKYLEEFTNKNFSKFHTVYLWSDMIVDYHLGQIYNSLKENKDKSDDKNDDNIKGKKDVLLVLDSFGGSIEPAFKISKICNQFKKDNFIVGIPSRAKSAATLISMGANEIHMGPLSELGPIDPQLSGGLPALGVKDAFYTLAQVVTKYPGSTELFSSFIKDKINLHILGWLTRVPQSAAQYAQKLLNINYSEKGEDIIKEVATKLVEEYKTHGFVIDYEEAKKIFGKIDEKLIKANTDLIDSLENLHSDISLIELLINNIWNKPNTKIEIEITGGGTCQLFERTTKQ